MGVFNFSIFTPNWCSLYIKISRIITERIAIYNISVIYSKHISIWVLLKIHKYMDVNQNT